MLIFLQVAVAFTLFGVLQGLKTGVEHAISDTRADLLLVFSRLSMGEPRSRRSIRSRLCRGSGSRSLWIWSAAHTSSRASLF